MTLCRGDLSVVRKFSSPVSNWIYFVLPQGRTKISNNLPPFGGQNYSRGEFSSIHLRPKGRPYDQIEALYNSSVKLNVLF